MKNGAITDRLELMTHDSTIISPPFFGSKSHPFDSLLLSPQDREKIGLRGWHNGVNSLFNKPLASARPLGSHY